MTFGKVWIWMRKRFAEDSAGPSWAALLIKQCELLYATSPTVTAGNIIAALLLVAVQGPVIEASRLALWGAMIAAVAVSRWLLLQSWQRSENRRAAHAIRWRTYFRIVVIASGSAWGTASVLLFPTGDPVHQVFLAFALGGLSVGGFASLAVDRISVVGFMVPALVPLIISFARVGGGIPWVMAGLVALFMLFIAANAFRVGSSIRENTRLQIEAVEREAVLKQSEARLNQAQQIAQLGSFDWDLQSGEVNWSDEHFRLWGLPPGSLKPSAELWRLGIHPDDRALALERLALAIQEGQFYDCTHRVRWADGSEHHIHGRAEVILSPDGEPVRMIGTVQNVSQRKSAEDKIRELAFYDSLTRLPNRHLLVQRLRAARDASTKHPNRCALLLIDLDHFKNLNDTFGHKKGDMLLEQVSQRLEACVRDGDTVARLGGDEFVVLLANLSGELDMAALESVAMAERVLGSLAQSYHLEGHEYHGTSSIGITLFKGFEDSVDDLFRRADLAMYQAKAAGRNAARLFDDRMATVAAAHAALEADLRHALRRREFLLYFQPQVDRGGHTTGAEALIRWRHPERGFISPGEFIPVAEQSGLILPIGQWVLETACAQLAAWSTRAETAHLTLAVNVSARQFRHPEFVEWVLDAIARSGIDPHRLKMELTESLLLDNVEDVITKMTALKEWGIGFSLDDFGTGYSSLSYLKRLPLDQLKIDQTFVRDILIDANDAAIARTIVALGKSMGLAVIAEGVEEEGQRDFLANHGCYAYQGYLFGRPSPIDEFERHLRKGSAVPIGSPFVQRGT